MSKSKDKGDALEHAVLQIEGLILNQDPTLHDVDARIEPKQWFNIQGVEFEVDVLVTVGAGDAKYYHIIECKDWERPVGVEALSHLAMKQRLLQARHTTLVARKVTEPARALAALSRISIVPHSEKFVPIDITAPVFSAQAESGSVSLNFYPPSDGPSVHLEGDRTICLFRNNVALLSAVVWSFAERAIEMAEQRDPRRWLPGMHAGHARFVEHFRAGELVVAGKSVATMSSLFDYSTRIVYPAIVTKFGVKDRGGLIRAEYPQGTMGVKQLALEILTKPLGESGPH